MNNPHRASQLPRQVSAHQRISVATWQLVTLITLTFFAIYVRTAAPSVLSGDSAEFQLVAATLGVAHPTTYPLYTLLGHLATRLVPFGDLAWRVTLATAGCAALAIGLFYGLALRLGVSRRAALIGTIALGVTPGLWNAATVAEVYALLALLLIALAYVVGTQPSAFGGHELQATQRVDTHQHSGQQISEQRTVRTMAIAALIAGLGFTHHGLFAITALPPFAIWALLQRWAEPLSPCGTPVSARPTPHRSAMDVLFAIGLVPARGQRLLRRLAALLLGFLLGCTPWAYPLIQFARYGPFNGIDYGLPRHYFWGAPMAWPEVFDLLTGGTVRRGIFRIPTYSDVLTTLSMLWERANFEFGTIGLVLALVGGIALFRQLRRVWLVTLWVLIATIGYLLLLGPAVADAPIFTLPMLLPLAVWVTFGAQALITGCERMFAKPSRRVPASLIGWLVFALLLGISVAWADTRVEYASKRHLTLYRTFGEAVFAELPSNAVLIAHWEQGMIFQYLQLAEHQRPDVWVDVVEPADEAWGPRIARRYAGRPVFLIGQAGDVTSLPVELMREDAYALVFRLRR